MPAQILDQVLVIHARPTANIGLDVSIDSSERTDHIRFPNEPVQATGGHEGRMVSRDMAHNTVLHAVADVSFRRPGNAVVMKVEILEAVRSPTQHIGFDLIDRVPPWSGQ